MLDPEDIDDLLAKGATVLSIEGDKIGPLGQVYLDEETERPSWITVRTGLFGISESFVPVEGALTEGQDIRVPYTKDQITDAPQLDADLHLETAETDRLYRHYGLARPTYNDALTDTAATTPADAEGSATGTQPAQGRLRKYVPQKHHPDHPTAIR
jgi:sporulation protein YlmC with PRC-barrel domain